MNSQLQIISARWLIPIRPSNTVLHNHSVVIDNGRIVEISPTQNAIQIPQR